MAPGLSDRRRTVCNVKPGERVRLIKESAGSLSRRAWPEIQLVLSQFGLDTWANSNDDPLTYCMTQISEGSDDNLSQLHSYLMGEDAGPDQPAGSWSTANVSVFLSHTHPNRHFVGLVKYSLGYFGVSAFVAHDDIEPSKQWRDVIKEALRSCHAFVAFLHPGFHESKWCDQEVGYALATNSVMIPVRLGEGRRDNFLADFQDIVPAHENAPWVARRIVDTLLADPRTRDGTIRALAEGLVDSPNFEKTRELYELLAQQVRIEPEQLRRLEYAVQSNRQVYDAIGPRTSESRPIPDLIKELVAKHEPQPVVVGPEDWGDEPPF